jgi:hypothetical protein
VALRVTLVVILPKTQDHIVDINEMIPHRVKNLKKVVGCSGLYTANKKKGEAPRERQEQLKSESELNRRSKKKVQIGCTKKSRSNKTLINL